MMKRAAQLAGIILGVSLLISGVDLKPFSVLEQAIRFCLIHPIRAVHEVGSYGKHLVTEVRLEGTTPEPVPELEHPEEVTPDDVSVRLGSAPKTLTFSIHLDNGGTDGSVSINPVNAAADQRLTELPHG